MLSPNQLAVPDIPDTELADDSYLLSCLLEHSSDYIYFKDLDSRFIRISHTQARYLGLANPEEATGKTDRDFYGSKLANKARKDELKIIQTGQPLLGMEEQQEWPDGRVTWASTSKMPLFNADGKCIGTFGISRDITRGKEAEHAYRLVFQSSPVPMFVYDVMSLQFIAVNDAMIRDYGYTEQEFLAKTVPDIHPKEDVSAAWRNIEIKKHDLGPQKRGIWKHRKKNGEIIEVGFICQRLEFWGEDSVLVSVNDITERKRAEEAIRQAEEKYRGIFENAVLGIFQSTPFGQLIHINPALAQMHGYDSPDEMMKSISHDGSRTVVDPREMVELFRRAAEDRKVHSAELEIYRKDRSRKWVRMNVRIIRDAEDNILFREGTVEDITERKRNEEVMHRLSQVVEQSPVSVVITDLMGDIIYVNRRFTEISGYTVDEILGKNPRILKSGFSSPEVYRQLWDAITSGEEWHGVFHNRKKNGALYWESAVIGPIKNHHGTITHFLAIKEDISDKLALESQLRQSQKLEAIGQLAAGIAHEINTPIQYVGDNTTFFKESWKRLAGLLTAAQKLREEITPELVSQTSIEDFDRCSRDADVEYLTRDIPRAIEQTLEGVQRVSQIVRAMKEFSHPGSMEKRAIDLNRAIETTLTICRNEWKYLATVETHLDPDLPLVPCIEGEINQVLLNLIVNGAQAISEVVSGEGSMGKITLSTCRDGDWAQVSIADTGTGIPEHIRGRVFDPFFTTKEVGKGTGQGLMLAHTVVVTKHGGQIWFDSEIGKGTTFFVRLPISVAAEE